MYKVFFNNGDYINLKSKTLKQAQTEWNLKAYDLVMGGFYTDEELFDLEPEIVEV